MTLLSELAVALPLLVALVIAVSRSWLRDTWALAIALCLAVVWLRVSGRFEGPTLVRVTDSHGLVLADLVGLTAALLACLGWLRAYRREDHSPSTA